MRMIALPLVIALPLIVVVVGLGLLAGCQGVDRADAGAAPRSDDALRQADQLRTAEAGCARCIYHMEGVTDCVLGVKIDGKTYLVDGSGIDEHGDAHAADGLCNAARAAQVSGRIEEGRFVASHFELLAAESAEN